MTCHLINFFQQTKVKARGGTPLYKLYSYVSPPPPSGRIFAPFWSESGYTLYPFWSGMGYDCEGTTGVYERIYRFNSKWVRKKEKRTNSKWIWIIYWLRSSISNDNMKYEIGYEKQHFLVWNRVRIWRTGGHTPTKNSEEYPPPGGLE